MKKTFEFTSFVILFLAPISASFAQLIWSSDYASNLDLKRWDGIECGSPDAANCPTGCNHPAPAGGFRCSTRETPTPLDLCPAGENCRFQIIPDSLDQRQGPFLRVETHPRDRYYSGARNELTWGAECDQSNGICDNLVGLDRYYVWSTYFPALVPAPLPARVWHAIFQFHEVGGCSGNGPLMNFGLERFGDEYRLVLNAKRTYSCDDDGPIWQDSHGLVSGWHDFALQVHWATDNSGYYRLFVDGVEQFDARMVNRPTMYVWPETELQGCQPSGCDSRYYGQPGGHAMSVFMKHGNYHSSEVPGVEIFYHSDVSAFDGKPTNP